MNYLTPILSLAFFALALSTGISGPPKAEAHFTKTPPVVDGKWSPSEWDEAQPLFFPAPAQGEKPACAARFLWTEKGVYATFCRIDRTPVYGEFKPGEPIYQNDAFEIFIDQVGDYRQFYEIQMDPSGQFYIRNNILTAEPRLTDEKRLAQEFVLSELWRYDLPAPEGFKVASTLDRVSGLWTLEVFLPASFVNRRRGGDPMVPCTWRINLAAHDWDLPKKAAERKCKFMYWAPVLEGHPHLSPKAMGYLEFNKK